MGFDGAASLTSKTGHGDMKKRGVHFQTASWKTWTNLEKLWKTMVFQPGKATNRHGKIHGFSHFPWNNGGKSSISPERWAASGWPRAFLAGGASTCQVGGLGPLVSCQTQREIRRKLCWRLLDGIFERRLNSTCQRILPRLRPSFLLLLPASSGDVAAAIKLSNCRCFQFNRQRLFLFGFGIRSLQSEIKMAKDPWTYIDTYIKSHGL